MMQLRSIFLLVFGISGLWASGQNASADFYRINKAYQASENLLVVMKINAYRSWADKVSYEQKNCTIKKNGPQKYTNIEQAITIANKNYSLTVDHEQKKILLLPARITETPFSDREILMPKLDSVLLKVCKKVEFNKEADGNHSYQFTMEAGDYEKMKIVFSPKTYLLQRITFYYRDAQQFDGYGPEQKPRLEIQYTKTEFPKSMDESDFTYANYLVKQGNKLVCRPQYKSYQLINQLSR